MIAHNVPRVNGKVPPTFLSGMGPTGIALLPVGGRRSRGHRRLSEGRRQARLLVDRRRLVSLQRKMAQHRNVGAGRDAVSEGRQASLGPCSFQGDEIRPLVRARTRRVRTLGWRRTIRNGSSAAGGGLLNLGNPEARKWLTEHISRLIKEQGIDLYREDFNIDPLGILARQRRPIGRA